MYTLFDEKKESLVAYFLLPMLGMSFKKFGAHFLDAKITKKLDAIVIIAAIGCKESYWDNEFYQNDFDVGLHTRIVFRIPKEFEKDVELFVSGKYTKLSKNLKDKIYKHSGLYYNKQIDNKVVTDKLLLSLTRSKVLEDWILKEFGIKKGKNSEYIKLVDKNIIYFDGSV